jgi:hypothetical protein
MPAVLATQQAEIRRIAVQSQPRQIVPETLSGKNTSQKRVGGVVQMVGPKFKPQYRKKKKNSSPSIPLLLYLRPDTVAASTITPD